MQLTTLDKWYDDVRLEVSGAPNPLIDQRLRLSAIEVCKRTLISQEEIDPVDIELGVADYRLEPLNTCLKIWRVLWIRTPDRVLKSATRRTLASEGRDWTRDTGEAPLSWVNLAADQIQLIPKPSKAIIDGFTPYVAFVPSATTKKLDTRLFTFYKEVVLAGTVSKLLRITGTDWFDKDAANHRELEFQAEISKILANNFKDESVADLHVAMRPFV